LAILAWTAEYKKTPITVLRSIGVLVKMKGINWEETPYKIIDMLQCSANQG
jgi:hypothetical protein